MIVIVMMKLLKKMCPHLWKDTAINKWFIAIEQQCRICGAYRHHGFRDLVGAGKIKWHEGKNKKAPML